MHANESAHVGGNKKLEYKWVAKNDISWMANIHSYIFASSYSITKNYFSRLKRDTMEKQSMELI